MRLQSNFRTYGVWWICLVAFALLLAKVLLIPGSLNERLMAADTDDLMRLAEVRDLLNGQSWFDTHQYRVLPPEGISIHWSRYIDAGIAGIYLALSQVLAPATAELWAVTIWPMLLASLMILLLAHGTHRLFGLSGAIGAVAVFVSWGKFGGEFIPTRIDHHNLQMLCATAAFYLAAMPGRPLRLGAAAGVVTAFGLAIGLEMLPVLATVWGYVALSFAFGRPGAREWLLGFGPALGIAAPLFMAGQTAPSAWWINYCDVLAPPVLALAAIGIVATLVPVLASQVLRGPLSRIAAMLVLGGIGLWLAGPVLLPCSAGPYSVLPADLRDVIQNRIVEARSIFLLFQEDLVMLLATLVPPLVVCLAALAVALALRGRLSEPQKNDILQSMVVALVGFGVAAVQIRAANLIAPALPLLSGFLVHAFARIPRTHRLRGPASVLLVLSMPATAQVLVGKVFPRNYMASSDGIPAEIRAAKGTPDYFQVCLNEKALAEIASLPKSLVFTSMSLGPALVVFTDHDITSAPYHRNPEAFWNGALALESEANLRRGLSQSGADYLVICRNDRYDWSLPFLLPDRLPDWLVEVTDGRKLVRVFQIDRQALAKAEAAP